MARLSEAVLRDWMQRSGPQLIALSAGICRDRHAAEEIVQEAFVKLWNQPPDGGERVYPSWLRRVVTNASINWIQRRKRPAAMPEYGTDRALQTEDAAPEQGELVDRISLALEQLDPSKRAILLLRAREKLTYEQIAAHLDVPVGTVMSRLNRARAALKDAMDGVSEADPEPRDAQVYPFRRYLQA